MAEITLKFGSFDMSEEIEEMDEGLNSRVNASVVPKRHGVVVTEIPVLEGRIIRMRGSILTTDRDEARIRLFEWNRALNAGRQRLQIWDDLYVFAFKQVFNYAPIIGMGFRGYTFNVEFLCDDPFLYKVAGGVTLFRSMTSPPIDFDVDNQGSAYVQPRFQFIADMGGDLTPPTKLINTIITPAGNVVQKTFQYNGTVVAGTVLDVVTYNFTVDNDGNRKLKFFEGDFIWLNAGVNHLSYVGSPCTFAMTYNERFV